MMRDCFSQETAMTFKTRSGGDRILQSLSRTLGLYLGKKSRDEHHGFQLHSQIPENPKKSPPAI